MYNDAESTSSDVVESRLCFPCSAGHERDWPPCKVVFFGLTTNALNVRNNNNNYVLTGVRVQQHAVVCAVYYIILYYVLLRIPVGQV